MESKKMKPAGRVVTLDQVSAWSDLELFPTPLIGLADDGEGRFADPLISPSTASPAKFPCHPLLNSKLFLWRGDPWVLSVDAVVNSSNETLDVKESSPGLHNAAGPRLAEECAALGGCRTGMAQITGAYELPSRKVIHTVGPKYVEKYHTAVESALSRCYQSCFELLIENGLKSIALGCIYTEAKEYPREQAAHVALRTVRRFLEKYKDRIEAVVLCLTMEMDIELYERLLLLYFPRNIIEEHNALLNLPADVGDENGDAIIDERKIRIKALPLVSNADAEASSPTTPSTDHKSTPSRSKFEGPSLDSTFLIMTEDPDRRREEEWRSAGKVPADWFWSKWLGHGKHIDGLDTSFHHRYLARAKAVDLSEAAEMKILFRGGVDREGHQVMVIVGAHFLRRCLDLEQFLLYVVKEFEPVSKEPYSVVYFHSAAALHIVPDTQWVKHLHQIMGPKHKANLRRLYMVHPTVGLKASVLLLRLLADPQVWAKVTYLSKLSDLFRYVPQNQLAIPDFVYQHDKDVRVGSQ